MPCMPLCYAGCGNPHIFTRGVNECEMNSKQFNKFSWEEKMRDMRFVKFT